MAGLVPAIHVFLASKKQDVDARHKAGHDAERGDRMTPSFIRAALAALVLAAVAQPMPLAAQDWPQRPIRIVVGFGPGGGTDIAARIVAEPLSKALGQPVVVENRVGAGGTTAAEQVAKSPKDGYTALMMSNAHAVTPAMYKTLRYDPIGDFQMVSMVGTAGLMLVVAPGFPAKDLKGVIAHAKQNPGKLNFGSPGVGTTQHFSAEFMKQLAGLAIQHVPYKSTPASLTALIGGEVQLVIELIQTVQGQVQAGTLRAIAVTSPQRFPTVPDIPTFAESGLPGYDVTSWYGLSFPAGTPAPIVARTNKAMRDLLASDTVRAQILKVGALVRSSTPDELKDHIAGEIARWKSVRDKAGIEQQ
jgi:tripartite-type tricarboxylate transporter receptor subunit TctC